MTRRRTRAVLAAAAAGALLLAAGCAADEPEQSPAPSPLAGCDRLTDPPPAAAGADNDINPAGRDSTADPTGPAGGGSAAPLPELTLPCFTGGEPVPLAELAGPAVINLWASWCAPCRAELPELQQYADQAGDQVHVLGVVTRDRRAAAVALAEDLGVSFPALEDEDELLHRQLDGMGLPMTLFVDRSGTIAYLHQGALDRPRLEQYAGEHLGVTAD